jgi:hypothetical protein
VGNPMVAVDASWPHWKAAGGLRGLALRLPSLIVVTTAALCVATCSQEQTGYTDEQRDCIKERFGSYDPTHLDRCIDVCKACMKGNTVTCNTSCRLKGAS